MTNALTFYRDLLADIKARLRQSQQRAALSANAEMLRMYWDIGRMIAARQEREGWGAGVIPRLASDLKNELPEEKGFSVTNLKRMVQFSREYPELFSIGALVVPQLPASISNDTKERAQPVPLSQMPTAPQAVSLLSWGHNVVLMQKIKDLPVRHWYAYQTLTHGWSRDTLSIQIKNHAHERAGNAVTNFQNTLPTPHASLADSLLKDPYLFDFLTLEEPFHERELETGLLVHLQKFLLELGRGFAFVGRQYPLEVSNRDFYIDLLFYHLNLRCFVVVELKKGDFKPEYAGKMNFYCSAVDDLLRHEHDAPTIGLILCQTKDRVLAEYALRDIHKPIGVADYELTHALPEQLATSLPSIESLENELSAAGTKENS
ncbi:MAG: PDDEXK nuclease domain-containing protein [Zoogloeaceae bacterium]|jgi:predicted nuclease of restriction endonuclease-like (RecB) superfamily|nr:PDDEXK nuclease domain-containing protein [Zoogloeaceae bacterium]